MSRLASARELRDQKTEPLLDFFERINVGTKPKLVRPYWLEPLAKLFDRALYEPVKAVVNVPPQHGKSSLAFAGIARHLLIAERPVLYVTYSEDFATSQMRRARRMADVAGVPFRNDSRSICEWNLTNGAELYATGVGGSITGRPAGLIVLDDLIKGWKEAQSAGLREFAEDWFAANVDSRIHPDTSVIFPSTRWHEEDISQRLIDQGFEHINLPAIKDDGSVLWPEGRPLEFLEERRKGKEFIFEALYQGRPRPRGSEVFGLAHYCDHIPREGRVGIGIDLAYSSKTHADYSVSVVLVQKGDTYTVADVVRKQVQATDFALSLKAHASAWRGAKMRWACSGTEKGTAQFLRQLGLPVDEVSANRDKLARALPVSAAWNQGKILVPRNEPWTEEFVREVTHFAGVNDPHDDQVDALASAFDLLSSGAGLGQYSGSGSRLTTGMSRGY